MRAITWGTSRRRAATGMRRRAQRTCRPLLGGAVLLLALSPAATALSPAATALSPAVTAKTAPPDITSLLPRATGLVRAEFPKAVLLEADGTTRGGRPTRTAAGIVAWKLGFDTNRSPQVSAAVAFGPWPKRFGHVHGSRFPILEDVMIRKDPRMTLRSAVSDLRRAGYRDSFTAVTLRNPLGPRHSNPLYIFATTHHGFVAVDTKTARVKVIH